MGAVSTGEIPLLSSFLYLFDGAEAGRRPSPGSFVPRLLVLEGRLCSSHFLACSAADLRRRQCQVGSLAGAAHLSNDNAGVLRRAQRERKSRVEQKGKSLLDSDFQYEYEL